MRYELWQRVGPKGAFNWMVYDTDRSPVDGATTWFATREEAEEMIKRRAVIHEQWSTPMGPDPTKYSPGEEPA